MKYFYLILSFFFLTLSSCLGGDDYESDYSDWKAENERYIANAETEMLNGNLKYEKIVPDWETSIFTLVHWYNDRKETQNGIKPLSNSTIDVKYLLTNIYGDTIDSSESFRCQPCNMITGFWVAVTNMYPGDSVSAVIPADAGYGTSSFGSVLPYSTLIFDIKLDSIVAYEKRP